MIYFSEFNPPATSPGAKGTTSALLTSTSYNAIIAAFSDIGDDDKLTAVEKQQVIREYNTNVSVNTNIVTQATSLSITTELTSYNTAYSDLNTYLITLSPAWNDVTQTTDINRISWKTYWSALYTTRFLLQIKINQIASERAVWSAVYGSGKPDDFATRNVPAGTWSSLSTYQRGDLATNIAGDIAYIAKQYVPAGILQTNTIYWDVFVQGGGSNGQNAFQPYLSNNPITIPTNSNGTGGDFSSANGQYKLWEGTIDRSSSATYSVVGSPTWVTLSAGGGYTVTDPGVDRATAQFDASFGGTTHRLTLQFIKVRAGTNGTNGAPGTNGINGTTTYTWIAYADNIDGTYNFTTGIPGTRNYIGIAANQISPTEGTNPNLYTWARYTGPAAFGLVPSNNVLIGSDFIVKSGTITNWDASAYSSESFTGGCLVAGSANSLTDYFMFGLNTDPTSNNSFNTLDYAWYAYPITGFWHFAENGNITETNYPVVVGQAPSISYNGKTIEYRKHDGTLVRSLNVSSGLTFWFDSSLYNPNSRINNVRWMSIGAAGVDGVNGLQGNQGIPGTNGTPGTNGAPGTNGTNGTTFYTWVAYADNITGTVNFTTSTPSGRAFIGIAVNQTSPVEGSNPNVYQWSAYTGPPSFGLINNGGVNVAGGKVQKIISSFDWDASAYSSESFTGGVQLSFKVLDITADLMVGINTDPISNNSFNTLDYSIRTNKFNGLVDIYESESQVYSVAHTWTENTVWTIHYNGQSVRYYKDGVLLKTTTIGVTPGLKFFADSSIYSPNGGFIITGFTAAGADGRSQFVHFAYADSPDGSLNFTTGFIEARRYIGTLVDSIEADSNNYLDYTWSYLVGQNGTNGTPGQNGSNGQPSYVHTAYANSANGTVDFDLSDPVGRIYLGVYTDQTLQDSNNPATYTWSLIKGDNGQSAIQFNVYPTTIIIAADSYGVPKPGQLPKNIAVTAKINGIAQTINSINKTDINCTSNVQLANNLIELTAVGLQTSSINLAVTVGSETYNQVISIVKQQDATPPSTLELVGQVSGTASYVSVCSGLISTNTTGILKVNASSVYYKLGVGSNQITITGKIRCRPVASSFTDIDSATGSSAYFAIGQNGEPSESVPGYVVVPASGFTDIALTPNTNYEIDYQTFRSSGTGTINNNLSSSLLEIARG